MLLPTTILTLLLASLPVAHSAANQLQRITNFGANPSNVGFYLYVPTRLQANPPILVNPHACHGRAQDAFTGTQLATLADTYGYIMIFPDSPNTADKCWDVSSSATLSHNGGGDSYGIVSMVKWTLANYNGNPNRVFAMGTSSGAMMTNVLLGAYPDVFAAGSAWAGVAFGCYAGNGVDVWSGACATGQIIKSGAEWATIVRNAYPGYSGFRPKMHVLHGTQDNVLYPQNLQEEIKQWTAVFGYPSSPVQSLTNTPNPGWTTYVYGNYFRATSAAGVTHDIQTNAQTVLDWFDLKCSGNGCFSRTGGGSNPTTTTPRPTTTSIRSTTTTRPATTSTRPVTTSSRSTTTTSRPPATTSAGGGTQTKYGQCGGIGYTGPTICAAGSTCTYSNPYYSQCL